MKNRAIPLMIGPACVLALIPFVSRGFQSASQSVQPAAAPTPAGHTPNPNWPYFLTFAEREFKAAAH